MVQGFLNRNSFKTKETIVNEYKAFDSATITVDNTVKLLDLSGIKAQARAVHIYVTSNVTGRALRYTYDGSTPTALVGIGKQDSDEFILSESSNLQKFKVTEAASGTTTLFITYLK